MFFKYRRSVRKPSRDILYQWISANHLVANAGKCDLLSSSKVTNNIAISNTNVSSEQEFKLLGRNLESRLNFYYHVNTLLNKANKKYNALAKVCQSMNTNKRRVLMKVFITSQFSYSPLVWMFHSIPMNNRIKLHEKALKLAYTNKPNLSFDNLLKQDKSAKIHQKNLLILAPEIYKVKNYLGLKIMADIFHFVEKPYNLRNNSIIQRQASRKVYFGT